MTRRCTAHQVQRAGRDNSQLVLPSKRGSEAVIRKIVGPGGSGYAGRRAGFAVAIDGRDLDAEGSQPVVPTDRCGARYVSAITHVWFGACAFP
jgi:hypothetical protein